jgi:hypothetical protein
VVILGKFSHLTKVFVLTFKTVKVNDEAEYKACNIGVDAVCNSMELRMIGEKMVVPPPLCRPAMDEIS